jgi:hypothetical protein
MRKRGEILIGNVIFILLNAVFLFILILFLLKQGEGAVVLEQVYAKQIALLADSAKPEMLIKIDMEKGMNVADKNGIDFVDVVKVNGNLVSVKLNHNSGYTYSFFNDEIILRAYPDQGDNGMYVLTAVRK